MSERVTVYDEQGNRLILGPNDHLATGGEGSVYARADRVFKVYLDPEKARRARLEDKIELLKQLQHPGIAAPNGVLRNKDGAFVGLTLARVQGEALCKLFTNTWRDAHQFALPETEAVARAMRDVIEHAHAHRALLVDGNELNWLVDGTRAVAIDVDSWQLPGFPATAIMASIQDPLLKASPAGVLSFSEGSDWFAWAVVTFQLFTGIHPFKGSHPDFARNALAERMRAGASVFGPKVSLPAAARPLADIPPVLRQWYQAVFEQGVRSAPPTNWTAAVGAQTAPRLRVSQLSNAALRQERLGNAQGRILAAFNGFVIARDRTGLVLWDALKKAPAPWVSGPELEAVLRRHAALVRLPATEALVVLAPGTGLSMRTRDGAAPASALPSRASSLWQSGNRLFAVVEGASSGLIELKASQLGARALLSVDKQWPVNALSTRFHRGCFVQDCLGTPFVGVLEADGLVQMKAPALKNLHVIEALGIDRHNVWMTAVRKSDGQTVRLRLSANAAEFVVAEEDIVSEPDLVGAVLASGVGVVRLGEDLRVCRGAQAKQLGDCGLAPHARLFSLGAGLGLLEDTEVSRLSLG